jgi:hypothetical protein
MSAYFDNKDENFMEPKVNQYGRNMVMTNVTRESKRKYVNIDTRFRDEYTDNKYNDNIKMMNCNITLPERIANVKSVMVCNAEIPVSYYNVSASLGNHFFQCISGNINKMVVLPDSQYTITTLVNKINSLAGTDLSLNITDLSGTTFSTTNNNTYTISFDTDISGNFDKYNFKSKLGWLLGFRKQSYTINKTTPSISEAVANLSGPRYLYIVLDEFNQNTQNSFISPQSGFLLNKNIIARIATNPTIYSFGAVIPANNFNGYLLTDRRTYTGTVDLKRLHIQLVNELGVPMNLNGLDFSFCLEIVHE